MMRERRMRMRNKSLEREDVDLDKSSAFCVVERVYGYGFMSLRICNDTSQCLRYFFYMQIRQLVEEMDLISHIFNLFLASC